MSKPADLKHSQGQAASRQGGKEPRGARRRRETRRRLLKAALELMSERGMQGVAINEITEVADVGFGSFYNHFESKEAIYSALVDAVFDSFGESLAALSAALDDPAEIVAASVRYTLLRARQRPVWGDFLLQAGLSGQMLTQGLGRHLMRDMQAGYASGRFTSSDQLVSFLVIGGSVLASIAAQKSLLPAAPGSRAIAGEPDMDVENLPERVAASILLQLGLPAEQAAQVANRALPDMAFPDDDF